MENEKEEFIQKICQVIYDKKGFNILALDVKDISTIADCLIIAEGNVGRHVAAIAHSIVKEIEEKHGLRPHTIEGVDSGDWVLLDYVDVIVHMFMPGTREKFRLEELWSKGKPLELKLALSV
jgi:ribosome-associated protein